MPVIIAAFIGALAQAAFSIVGRVLLSLGIGLTVMTGISASLTFIKNEVAAQFSGLPAVVLDTLSACQLGTATAIVFSALSARLLFDGMSEAGVLKRWGAK